MSKYAPPFWSSPPEQKFSLEVMKGGICLEQISINSKPYYVIGRDQTCDIKCEHPSISRFHAAVQFRGDQIYVYDMGSSHGTFVNKQAIKTNDYVEVQVGDMVKFGASSRLYAIEGPANLLPPERSRATVVSAPTTIAVARNLRDKKLSGEDGEDDGINWGQAEDAVDDEPDDERDDSQSDLAYKARLISDGSLDLAFMGLGDVANKDAVAGTKPLTERQQKLKEKLQQKQYKLQNFDKEYSVLMRKRKGQGDLSEGQQKRLSQLETLMSEAQAEIDDLEANIEQSQNDVAAGGQKKKQTSKHISSDEGSEDEFYDRTTSKGSSKKLAAPKNSGKDTKKNSGISEPTTTTEIDEKSANLTVHFRVQAILSDAKASPSRVEGMIDEVFARRDGLRQMLLDYRAPPTVSDSQKSASGDSLDSFMQDITGKIKHQSREATKEELRTLEEDFGRLQAFLEKRQHEDMAQRYREGDTEIFARMAQQKQSTARVSSIVNKESSAEVDDDFGIVAGKRRKIEAPTTLIRTETKNIVVKDKKDAVQLQGVAAILNRVQEKARKVQAEAQAREDLAQAEMRAEQAENAARRVLIEQRREQAKADRIKALKHGRGSAQEAESLGDTSAVTPVTVDSSGSVDVSSDSKVAEAKAAVEVATAKVKSKAAPSVAAVESTSPDPKKTVTDAVSQSAQAYIRGSFKQAAEARKIAAARDLQSRMISSDILNPHAASKVAASAERLLVSQDRSPAVRQHGAAMPPGFNSTRSEELVELEESNFEKWLPPENQKGDGKTRLNAKFGY